MVNSERKFSPVQETEDRPKIVIKKSSDAPADVKTNPFYDPEFWGAAFSPDEIYLPDSDEAISFAIAGHEIGHLVAEGKNPGARFDNFEGTRAEEQRAWDVGWDYLQKYLSEYYQDRPETTPKIQDAFQKIKDVLMRATILGKSMYVEPGTLDGLSDDQMDQLLKERRENFFSEKGEEFKQLFDEMKKNKIGVKPDWEKFIAIVKKAVKDILKDNERDA
ncbi:hypothetical protein KJ785_01485 [Patescibacteria group bacterium]|nr:hypothetical protein [Patescibacteria group bacterium]